MQSTITAYFAAFGIAQMIYGPWADQAGRKLPLYAGIAHVRAGHAAVHDGRTPPTGLIAGRFVQGLGGAALGVVPRAIVRDMMTGAEATRMMAAIMLVFSVSPMLAPLAGSALLLITGWRGIFGALLLASVVSLALLAFAQPETLPPKTADRSDYRHPAAWLLGVAARPSPSCCGPSSAPSALAVSSSSSPRPLMSIKRASACPRPVFAGLRRQRDGLHRCHASREQLACGLVSCRC